MKFPQRIDKYRVTIGLYASNAGDDYGCFLFPGPGDASLRVIASPGNAHEEIPWEHISVSTAHRCPTWEEMCWIKDIFWDKEESVMQLHPPESTWINNHPFCLHLWRPLDGNIPLPPQIAVGLKGLNPRGATRSARR